eukprot:359551-Chlamydomonas_euryale.AAC.5
MAAADGSGNRSHVHWRADRDCASQRSSTGGQRHGAARELSAAHPALGRPAGLAGRISTDIWKAAGVQGAVAGLDSRFPGQAMATQRCAGIAASARPRLMCATPCNCVVKKTPARRTRTRRTFVRTLALAVCSSRRAAATAAALVLAAELATAAMAQSWRCCAAAGCNTKPNLPNSSD